MRNLIKRLFDLYDEDDLKKEIDAVACTSYLEGYEEGKKVGKQQAIFEKYTPNQIRAALELDSIKSESDV